MGKTKDLTINGDGTCTFYFKDDACGEDGVFDPGANEVGLVIEGMGKASMLLSRHFFPIIKNAGVKVHCIDFDVDAGTMTGTELKILPAEFIWREKAWGSFCRTYGVEQGTPLDGLVEATLKSDPLGDPRINREALVKTGKMTAEQYDTCDKYTRLAGKLVKDELQKYGYELIDIKFEFGLSSNNEIYMADEISGGIWRVLKNGEPADPIECAKTICGEFY